MPLKTIKTSYNAGELSPYMDGRTDINKYHNGCSKLINATVLPHGGVIKRSGTKWIGKAPTKANLLPFEFSVDDALILEFSEELLRFYKSGDRVYESDIEIESTTEDTPVLVTTDLAHGLADNEWVYLENIDAATSLNDKIYLVTVTGAGGDTKFFLKDTEGNDINGTGIEVGGNAGSCKRVYQEVSPYTSDESFEIHTTQSADVMYIAHGNVHPKKLSRFSDTDWTIVDVPFIGGPFLAENTEPSYTLQFTSTAKHDGGGVATLTDSSQAWMVNKYVGRVLYNITQDGFGTITANTATTISAVIDKGNWADNDTYNIDGFFIEGMEGTLEATNHTPFLGTANDVGSIWRLKAAMFAGSTTTPDNATNAIPDDLTNAIKIKGDFTFSVSNLDTATHMAKLWRKPLLGSWEEVRSFTTAAIYTSTEKEDNVYYAWTESDAGIDGTLTAKSSMNIGIVEITAQTDKNTATVKVKSEVQQSAAISAAADAVVTSKDTAQWSEGAWGLYRGYPKTVTFFEDRLWWASSTNNPDTLWSSKTGDYENMEYTNLGVDDDAIIAPINDNEVSQIQWMLARQVMAIGAANKEYRFGASNPDNAVTPSDRKATPQTSFGSGDIQPVVLNNAIFFLQRQGKKLRAMKFDAIAENFTAEDATLFAYTILDSAPTCMAVQRVPDSIIWIVRTDGVLLSFTYEPDEDAAGWARHITQNSAGVETPVGFFESVAVIHGSVEDEVWVSVRRVINDVTVRYVERFATRFFDQIDEAMMLDSAVVVSSVFPAQNIILASDTVRCNNGLCNSSLCGGVPS